MNMQEKMLKGMFEGPIIPMILKIAIPIFIGSMLSYIYLFVDTYFISMLDPSSSAPLAGTGLIFPIFFTVMSIASSLAVGLSIITGKMIGEKKFDQCKSLGISGIVLALALGVPFIAICYLFGSKLIYLLAGNELSHEAATYGLHFLYSLAPGLIFMILTQIYGGILLGEGLPYVTTIGSMIMIIFNIILDPILMFVLKLGVAGAGLATTISIMLSFVFILQFIRSGRSRIPLDLRLSQFNKSVVKKVIYVGLPQFLMTISFYVIIVVFNKIITSSFEEYIMNAWALTLRIDEILIIPIMAIGGATTVFVSQNYGRRNVERIKKALRVNLTFVFLLCSGISLIYMALAPILFSKFTEIPEVVELATKQVYITSFTFGFMAIVWVVGAFFQSIGEPIPAMIILYARVVFTIVLGVVLVYRGFGIYGIFVSIAIGNVVIVPLAYIWISKQLNNIRFESIVESDLT